jgi:hypothetical protein
MSFCTGKNEGRKPEKNSEKTRVNAQKPRLKCRSRIPFLVIQCLYTVEGWQKYLELGVYEGELVLQPRRGLLLTHVPVGVHLHSIKSEQE